MRAIKESENPPQSKIQLEAMEKNSYHFIFN